MITKSEQKLINKWLKIFNRLPQEDLIKKYEEDYKDRGTPRREEDKAIKKALEYLLS